MPKPISKALILTSVFLITCLLFFSYYFIQPSVFTKTFSIFTDEKYNKVSAQKRFAFKNNSLTLLNKTSFSKHSSTSQINVISMSLYGSSPRYTSGAIENARLATKNFPGWQLWFYVEQGTRYPSVDKPTLTSLHKLGARLQFVDTSKIKAPPMMWRFLVADNMSVDRFIIRDADSRLTERDAFTVAEWVRSGTSSHCVRDHPSHAAYAMSGGLWGARPRKIKPLLKHKSWAEMIKSYSSEYLQDMNFLNNVIWPLIQPSVYCSDSVSCQKWDGSYPIKRRRIGYEHIGGVYINNKLRDIDVNILKKAGENLLCT